MPCCAVNTLGGRPGGGSVVTEASVWTERYLGDVAAAPAVDLALAVPPNPTVAIANTTTTTGQVASCTWTSNAGDASPTVTQGTVGSFATDNATGLAFVGASASTLMTEASHNAPHIWAEWADVLGESPRGGVDYCFLVRFALQTVNTAAQACGTCIYSPNDGSAEANLVGSPAIDDEKRLAGWIENVAGTLTILGREESTPFQGMQGAAIPGGFDTVGLLLRGGGGIAETVVGVSVGGVLPDPDAMAKVPGPFLGGSTTYSARPYLTNLERLAIAGQQQIGSTYDWTVDVIRVLSRGGRSTP